MKTDPEISILMPMLNVEPYLDEAVRSVLRQKDVSLELIAIDDGCTDGSREVLARINDDRVRVIDGPRAGIAQTVNAGLAAARGQWIARCDGDDCFADGRLSLQLNWLKQNPDFIAISGGFDTMTARSKLIRHMECGNSPVEMTDHLRDGHALTHLGTWLIRRTALEAVGGCRSFFRMAEDIDLQLRLGAIGRVWFDPHCAYKYRLHEKSITHTSATALRRFYQQSVFRFHDQRLTTGTDDLERGCPPVVPDFENEHIDEAHHHTQRILIGAAWRHHESGKRGLAVRTALRACLTHPFNMEAWKNLGVMAIRGPQS